MARVGKVLSFGDQAIITEFSISQGWDGVLSASINLVSPTPQFMTQLIEAAQHGKPLTSLQMVEDEWMCAFCASPNGVSARHCTQCGGPRGFLLGGR
jgi:hypothetical protein